MESRLLDRRVAVSRSTRRTVEKLLGRRAVNLSTQAERRRRRTRPSPSRPAPTNESENGSGTDGVGTPDTLTPNMVANEKVALLTVVPAVIAESEMTKVADWFKNGLCGPLPAMEALEVVNGPGPIIVSDGVPVAAVGSVELPHIMQRIRLVPFVPYPQPVDVVGPRVVDPFELTVICWPELDVKVLVPPTLRVNSKSLSS